MVLGAKKTNQDSQHKIYAVYIRVSTTMQAEEGDSIEAQLNLAREYVEEHGGILPEENIFIEPAVSARKTKLTDRTVLMECLNKAKQRAFDTLIVYRRDRLARRIEDSLAIRNVLAEAGVNVVFTATGEMDMDLNDPYSKMFENIRASMDEIESIQTGIRVGDIMKDKAKRGEWTGGTPPYGYKLKDNGEIVFIESQREIIKEIEELYLSGFGLTAIAKYFNGFEVQGLGKRPGGRVPKIKNKKSDSDHWTKEGIGGILFNPFYAGYISYNPDGRKKHNSDFTKTILAKGSHEAVRTIERQKALWALRDAKREKRKPPRHYSTTFLLTGLLFCKECGTRFVSSNSTSQTGKKYAYYRCYSKCHGVFHCPTPSFKKEILEEYVLNAISKYIEKIDLSTLEIELRDEIKKQDRNILERLTNIDKEIERKKKDYKALSRLILDLDMDDELDQLLKEQYQKDQKEVLLTINRLEVEKKHLEEKFKNHTFEKIEIDNLIDRLKNFPKILHSQTYTFKKRLLDELIDKIEIDKDGNVEITFNFELRTKEESEKSVDFISFGGVGDTVTPKTIKVLLPYNPSIEIGNIVDFILNVRKKAYRSFPQWLRHVANDPNLIPHRLHKLTGVAYTSCRYYLRENEKYRVFPNPKNMRKICKAFNVKLSDFLKFADINVSEKNFYLIFESTESPRTNLNIRRWREGKINENVGFDT